MFGKAAGVSWGERERTGEWDGSHAFGTVKFHCLFILPLMKVQGSLPTEEFILRGSPTWSKVSKFFAGLRSDFLGFKAP